MKLVFSGGGIKGIALIGALQALSELDFLQYFDTFAGSSIGGLILGLYLLGYSPNELMTFIMTIELDKIRSLDLLGVFTKYGIDSGERLLYVIKKLFDKKQISTTITMEEFHTLTKKSLYLTTTCVNTGKVEYLNHKTHPKLELIKAIRMTVSIPWYYTPVEWEEKLYIDGGVIDNYPIGIFEDINDVLGIYLVERGEECEIGDFETFIIKTFQCFVNGINKMRRDGYEKSTIDIEVDFINILNFNVSNEFKKVLFKEGYDSVMKRFEEE